MTILRRHKQREGAVLLVDPVRFGALVQQQFDRFVMTILRRYKQREEAGFSINGIA